MTLRHVNSATTGAAAPYDTWATAAATLAAVAAVATAGDEVFVHPSHVESNAGSLSFIAGVPTNPIRIVCGTPGSPSGITALQTTAQVNVTNTTIALNGSLYVYGIKFGMSTSGTSGINFNSVTAHQQAYESCEFNNLSTAAVTMQMGTTSGGVGHTTLNNCTIRFNLSTHFLRVFNYVLMNGCVFAAGTPDRVFILGSVSSTNGAELYVNGADFSGLGNSIDLIAPATKQAFVRIRNCKMPSGWSGALTYADLDYGCHAELLNYGTGDTNYKFWMESRQGIAKDETTIKLTTGAASDGTTSYSMRLTTLATVAYPSTIFRSPPVIKRQAAGGGSKTLRAEVLHDGAAPFTNKEVWLEVEYLGTSGFPLASVVRTRASYVVGESSLVGGSFAWDGDTGTGPNGSATWNQCKIEIPGMTFAEEGYVVARLCMAIPSKTLFFNPDFTLV
jgi:hypothetical protein